MPKDGLVVGLDVGSTKITIIVGEASENNGIYVLGSSVVQTAGIKKGMIVNIEETVSAIETAVTDAEHMADVDIDTVYVSIGGYHISGQNSRGIIAVPPNQREITAEEKQKVQEAARAIALPQNREIIHLIPEEYTVDDQPGIIDPIGMSGLRLEVDTHIITGMTTSIRNLQKSIKGTGLKIKDFLFEGLASGEAVVTADEKELGIVLVDIGGGTTDVVIYAGGYVKHTNVLAIGAAHITSDISIGLRTSYQEAEKIKLHNGLVWAEGMNLEEKITVQNAGNDGSRQIELKQLFDIIEPRMEEIFTMVKQEIKNSGLASAVPGGVILTGGGVLLNGTQKFAEKILGMPVRIGKPNNIDGLIEKINGPAFATCFGLLSYGLKNETQPRHSFIRRTNIVEGTVNWVKSFFKDIF